MPYRWRRSRLCRGGMTTFVDLPEHNGINGLCRFFQQCQARIVYKIEGLVDIWRAKLGNELFATQAFRRIRKSLVDIPSLFCKMELMFRSGLPVYGSAAGILRSRASVKFE